MKRAKSANILYMCCLSAASPASVLSTDYITHARQQSHEISVVPSLGKEIVIGTKQFA